MAMGLGKQAKTLSKTQCDLVLAYLSTTRHANRNRVIFLLSLRAGLRAKEIAFLTWDMVIGSDGNLASELQLLNSASKSNSGRSIPMSKDLRAALDELRAGLQQEPTQRVVSTERTASTSAQMIVNLLRSWYCKLGFIGCSSHSGRRTFITNAARRISTVGGSLRDVQSLAGHSSLSTTQRYIDTSADAKRRVVELI